MQKILITGANGFVGSRFVERWRNEFEILAPSHAELDITDAQAVERYVILNSPQVILHLAALSNTWYCEQHPDESYRVNVEGVRNLAAAAARNGVKFVFFSSDQVYNGNCESGPLSEDVAVAPETVYGRHKLEAEQRALELCPTAVALRVTWMYDVERAGMPVHANFVLNIAKAIKERTSLVLPVREYRGITWVRDIVEYLPATFNLAGGVYNYGAGCTMDTYETACCYCEMLVGLQSGPLLHPDYERYPNHERNLSMSTDKIFRASGGAICFGSTMDGLRIFAELNPCVVT
ncbi:MAG: NAD-dependent epimerase/dehydratase family protein [Bacteroidales bacterium]|nr:NAD-dependent epimerase/dehydratase family protein [Bacteroidales bacterium]